MAQSAEILEDRCLLATLTVNTLSDAVVDDAELSIREAILLVNEGGDANAALGRPLNPDEAAQINTATNGFGVDDTIVFDGMITPGQIDLVSPEPTNRRLEIFTDVTISGFVTLSGLNQSQIFFIGDTGGAPINVTLESLILTNGRADGNFDIPILGGPVNDVNNGGAIYSHQANLTLRDVDVVLSTARESGGGIYLDGGTLTTEVIAEVSDNAAMIGLGGGIFLNGDANLFNTEVSFNQTGGQGGGIFVAPGNTLAMTDSDVEDNFSSFFGGGLLIEASASAILNDTEVNGNTSNFDGGGIFASGSVTVQNGSEVSDNLANSGAGGGIYAVGGGSLLDSTIDNNSAPIFGGGLFLSSNFAIDGSLINGNTAGDGGGIAGDGTLTITNSRISFNSASGQGGGIINLLGTLNTNFVEIVDNSAQDGGGVYNDTGTINTTLTRIARNTATQSGGGMFTQDGVISFMDSILLGNFSPRGAGLFLQASFAQTEQNVTFNRSAATSNGSADAGGGIFVDSGTLTLMNSRVSENTTSGNATLGGGGIAGDANSTITITGTTISENRSGTQGGGIDSRGVLTITNTTISQNTADDDGGGVNANSGSSVDIFNSTIAGNIANFSTIGFGSGAGINTTSGTTTLTSTIVAGNESALGTADISTGFGAEDDIAGIIAAGNNNLIGNADSSGGLIDGANGNIVGNGGMGTIDLDTILDVMLSNNGGITLTHALVAGSPAIDNGANPNLLPFDQRGVGFDRESGPQTDIGAFEFQNRQIVVSDDENLLLNGGFENGLNNWITTSVGSGSWVVNDGSFRPPISGQSDAFSDTISAGTQTLFQTVDVPMGVTTATLRFSDLIENLGGAFAPGVQEFRVVLRDQFGTEIQEVFATNPGFVPELTPTFREFDVTTALQSVTGETATLAFIVRHNAGPLNVSLDDVSLIVGSGFSNAQEAVNDANPGDTIVLDGGLDGVLTEQGIVVDKDLTIQGEPNAPQQVILQAASMPGMATDRVIMVMPQVNLTIDNLTIRHGNETAGSGGGGILNMGTLMVTGSNLLLNNTSESGGGIKNMEGTVMLMGSTVGQNTAQSNDNAMDMGGGIFSTGGMVMMTNSTLSSNTAGMGGGIAAMGGEVINTASTITGNTSGMGGGILFDDDTDITLQSTIVAGNFTDVMSAPPALSDDSMDGVANAEARMGSDIVGVGVNAFVKTARNNIIGDAASAGGIMHGVNGNIVGNNGVGTLDINTVLDVLLKNNGGVTLTHALVPGSPAIDKGINPGNLMFDQRGPGFPRMIGLAPDIGAFESAFTGEPGEVEGPVLAFGTGGGTEATVRAFNEALDEVFRILPYQGFLGGVRVALADVTGDGVNDIVTSPGPGGGPHIRVFDGETGNLVPGPVGDFLAYDPFFFGGVFVAAADVGGPNGTPDGFADIITGAGAGGGPHVKVFSGVDGSPLLDFFAYNPLFLGGVSVAGGDINGDNAADVVTGAGPGGGPHVRVFSGVDNNNDRLPDAELQSFFAFEAGFTGGVTVGVNNTSGSREALIVTGSGRALQTGARVGLFNRPAGNNDFDLPNFAGVNVAVADVNRDGINDYILGNRPGTGGQVQILSGDNTVPPFNQFEEELPFGPTLLNAFPFGDLFNQGVFVAASIPIQ